MAHSRYGVFDPVIRKLLDSPRLYFGLAGLMLIAAVVSQFELNLPTRPVGTIEDLKRLKERDDLNVVFVLIDTLRADRLGAYGYTRDTSPMLDRLTQSGIRFAHVQSQSSWTKASMASLWTGRYPRRTGVLRFDDVVAPSARIAAEVFDEAGFRVAGIFRNGWVDANFGFNQGYDLYVKALPSQMPERFQHGNPSLDHPIMGTDLDITESAMEFIRSNASERFFLYLHYMDLHQYLYETDTADPTFGTSLSDAYDNSLRWTDRNLGGVVAVLEQNELLDRTLIVIASDHGESFYEHGLEGHARNLYREVTETPLILIPPLRLQPGLVVDTPVQNVDLWPTVLDLMGLDGLPGADGRSLMPLIEAAAGVENVDLDGLQSRASFAELDQTWGRGEQSHPIVAIVEGDYRFIYKVKAPKQPELYDHQTDPKELRNIASERPELVASLTERALAYLDNRQDWDVPTVTLDEMRKSQLRALGYIDLE